MSTALTHRGKVLGCDARTALGFNQWVKLRETKTMWVDHHGKRFQKKSGRSPGKWPMYRLDLDSINLLPSVES